MNPNESPPGGFLEFDLASAGEPKEFFVNQLLGTTDSAYFKYGLLKFGKHNEIETFGSLY